jgi:hypothetical protein
MLSILIICHVAEGNIFSYEFPSLSYPHEVSPAFYPTRDFASWAPEPLSIRHFCLQPKIWVFTISVYLLQFIGVSFMSTDGRQVRLSLLCVELPLCDYRTPRILTTAESPRGYPFRWYELLPAPQAMNVFQGPNGWRSRTPVYRLASDPACRMKPGLVA